MLRAVEVVGKVLREVLLAHLVLAELVQEIQVLTQGTELLRVVLLILVQVVVVVVIIQMALEMVLLV
jgi:hypothetical protein